MFTLRKITGDGVELNFFLGKSYTLILQDKNPKEFEENRQLFEYEVGETYGFVYGDDGKMLALFPKQQNYIMVDGKTVDYLKYNKSELPELKQKKNTLKKEDEDVEYKPFFQTQLNSVDRPYCIGLRANDEEDSIMDVYGEDLHATIVEFFDKLRNSDFIITMKD